MANVHQRPDIEEQVKELMVQALGDLETALAEDPRKKAPLGTTLLKQYAEGTRRREVLDPINIRDLIVPGVGNRRIFRILLTNACKYSCDYCPMRSQRDLPRHALEPARLAEIFLTAFRRGWCDGLFLTSGIPKSPTVAMEKMIELVSILRVKLGFRGYIHAKVMAGAEPGQIERIVRLVDRISYNL
ncbi:MAG TPA: hypothetical protein VGR00_00625, partial [Thermoanaerobaculia bacterium]|nr:hypothetical protein [Thermoanaerobaculia bacterium]